MGDIIDGVDCLGVYSGFTRCACVISQSFKNSLLCTCQGDKTISLRTDEGTIRQQLQNDGSRGISCMCVANASIWIGFSNGLIHVYDIASYILVHKYKESWGVLSMSYSVLLNSIFTGGHGKEILKWSCQDHGVIVKSGLPCHSSAIRSLVTEMHFLYSAGDDCSVRCWDVSKNTFNGAWVTNLGAHRAQQIVIDEEHLLCSAHEGIHILQKHNGQLRKFIAAGPNKYGQLMKDAKSESIWVSDSSGTVSVWDQVFREVELTISPHKPSLVSAMVPVSEICELLIFAQLREKGSSDSLSSLTRISASAANHNSSIRHSISISEVCLKVITEKTQLVNIRDATRWLGKSYEKRRSTISQLLDKQGEKKLLRRFFCKLLDHSKQRSVSLKKTASYCAKSLQRDVTIANYSKLYQNMRHRSAFTSMQSSINCFENHVRMIPYYRKLKALQHQTPPRCAEI